jgi:hypothetical protein
VTVITAQTYADFKTMLGMVGDAATDSATVKTLYYAAWDTGILFSSIAAATMAIGSLGTIR